MAIPTVHLLVTTNGRDDYLRQTLERAIGQGYLGGLTEDSYMLMVDDSGDIEHTNRLDAEYAPLGFTVAAPNPVRRAGQAASIEYAWNILLSEVAPIDYVFHLEDDFLLTLPINAYDMIEPFSRFKNLAQVVLMRQIWYSNERDHGGVIEARQAQGGHFERHPGLTKHQDHWSFNPCVYPVRLLEEYTYPQVGWAEALYGRILADAGWHFGYYGDPNTWPLAWHIGNHRVEGSTY